MWETAGPRREAYSRVEKDLSFGMAVLVFGLRRTGKTYLAHQILSRHARPFYFSFDKLAFQKPSVLEEVLRHAISSRASIIALDEVQKVQDWGGIVKSYYDHVRPRPAFLLSGSSSVQLKKGAESLAGRMLEHHLPVLSFSEFMEFSGIDAKFRQDALGGYLRAGAFPEAVLHGIDPSRYARSVVDKIVEEDIPKLYPVEHPEHLPDMVRLLAERVGHPVDWRDLGGSLSISKETAKRYAQLLEKSFLLDIVRMHDKYGSSVGKSKKCYLAHPQVAAAYAPLEPGFAAESAAYCHLVRFGQVGFFRKGREEVDFILRKNGLTLPIEVKYQQSIRASDTAHIRKYMGLKGTGGLVLTKNDEGVERVGGRQLRMVPLCDFLCSPKKYLGALA
jgi:predicted AAA+ superfamily ATPase